jgi:hypothetical protein
VTKVQVRVRVRMRARVRVGDFEVDSYFRFRGVAGSLTDFLVDL